MSDSFNLDLCSDLCSIIEICIQSPDVMLGTHTKAVKTLPEAIQILFENSFAHIFRSEEAVVWMLQIDFPICCANRESIDKYAIEIYCCTGIDWVRVCSDSKPWDIKRGINRSDP